ncbi:MAG TPA: bifunctional oligoribonuclease/PAP phosphatase NrnA [Chitinispirillaceae bacterium]|nr:bifunctional oligoribonuclease/PAP phosphatase NrnA [Chitinispirillaceae bacterium]
MHALKEQFWILKSVSEVKDTLMDAETIAIAGHRNPDGDSIGSMLALGAGLEWLGKKVYMLCEDPVPEKYLCLPGASHIVKRCPPRVDCAVAVDCGSREMLGGLFSIFQNALSTIEIDHHKCRESFAGQSIVNTAVASAGELVYELLESLGVPVTEHIACSILTSIIVETNSFRLQSMYPATFEICAELLKTGVDMRELSESVYWKTSRATAALTGISLSKCKFVSGGALVWAELRRKDFEKTGSTEADADPVPEKLQAIQGVRIAILFRETKDNKWRISFRSKNGLNVAHLAETFGGGGHLNAAGCVVTKSRKLKKHILLCANRLMEAMGYDKKRDQYKNSENVNTETFKKKISASGELSHILLNDTVLLQLNMNENRC